MSKAQIAILTSGVKVDLFKAADGLKMKHTKALYVNRGGKKETLPCTQRFTS